MPAPSPSWNTIRVFGTWKNLDGTLKVGDYSVTIPVRITNATDDVIVPAGVTRGDLATDPAGKSLDTPVPSTDDPDNLPANGWQVIIRVNFADGSRSETYAIDVPVAGGDIDLRAVLPVDPATIPAPDPSWVIGGPGGLAEYSHVPQVVVHGDDPNVARPPGAALVIWCGDAEPVHATGYDFRIPATG